MKLGILGGAFNPPHYGHLILAQEAFEECELDRVIFVPTYTPHFKTGFPSFEDRCLMTQLATVGDHRFFMSEIEHEVSTSYTVDMLGALKTANPDDELTLIIGGDQAMRFFTDWHESEGILDLASVVSASRGLYDEVRILDHWGDHADAIRFLNMPPVEISSSLLRERVLLGQSIRYFLPPAVNIAIAQRGLYREPA